MKLPDRITIDEQGKAHVRDLPHDPLTVRNATIARWNATENCFFHWREKFKNIFIETIKNPTDEKEPWWDVFDVVEELSNPPFEIPLDQKAEFQGNPADLTMYNEEMWGEGPQ